MPDDFTDLSYSSPGLSEQQVCNPTHICSASISLLPFQTLQDSGYGSHKRRNEGCGDKENSSPNRKARKALGPRWTTAASLPNMMFGSTGGDQSMMNPETPSKSLLGTDTSSSMLFSPPSILKVRCR